MGELLNNTVQIIVIISFVASIVAGITKYIVINPLQGAICTLNDTVKELKTMLGSLSEEQKCSDKRLVAVEESAKSAHKRLDRLEVHS